MLNQFWIIQLNPTSPGTFVTPAKLVPAKAESRGPFMEQANADEWIPACAGMT